MYHNPIKDWFYFSRMQRKGIILLMALIVIVPIASRMISGCRKTRSIDEVAFLEDLRKWEVIRSDLEEQRAQARDEQRTWPVEVRTSRAEAAGDAKSAAAVIRGVLFDPNSIEQEEWEEMGVPAYLARTIGNYLQAGGRFRYREDLRRIYLMEDAIYDQLESYIDLPSRAGVRELRGANPDLSGQGAEDRQAAAKRRGAADQESNTKRVAYADRQTALDRQGAAGRHGPANRDTATDQDRIADWQKATDRDQWHDYSAGSASKAGESSGPININLADTLELVRLWGIGPVFSQRIVRYREILGGFYDIAQLLEVFGMDSARFSGIRDDIFADTLHLRQIDINTADFGDLVRHPYIDRNLANAILNLRQQHGRFDCSSEIMRSYLVCDSLYRQVSPYLRASH